MRVSACARRLSTEQEVLLGGRHVAGDAELAGALGVLLGGQAHLVDLDLQVVAGRRCRTRAGRRTAWTTWSLESTMIALASRL